MLVWNLYISHPGWHIEAFSNSIHVWGHFFDVFFDLRLSNGWVNNREAGDLRRYRAHYDVIVMQ